MTLPTIRTLPPQLANQIAAGEVVERPASVLKELLENALDAGATALHLELENAGLTRLALTDNGHGMTPDQLPLALSRHATSKLHDAAGLFGIKTFGFRGEALPSMASVSRLTLTSRTAGDAEAWQITPQGELRPTAHPVGTRVEVADVFYATPARRKFLKSERTERLALEGIIKALLLAQPQVGLKVVEDGEVAWDVPAAQSDVDDVWAGLRDRAARVIGSDFAKQALVVQGQTDAGHVVGLVGPRTLHGGTAAKQWVFINGRMVRERALLHALKMAYGDALPAGRHPLGVLFLSLPFDAVDVNVHPAKTEVRLAQHDAVFSLVVGAVRQALAQGNEGMAITAKPFAFGGGQALHTLRQESVNYATRTATFEMALPPQKYTKGGVESIAPVAAMEADAHPLGAALGQVANTYIVAETAKGDMVVIDQHAAHERLVYEQLKAAWGVGQAPSQPLLIPAPVSLSPAALKALMAQAEDLARLGLVLEQAGPTRVMVMAMPLIIAHSNPAQMVMEVAEDLALLKPTETLQARMERVFSTFACHHSIRAHRRLSIAEQNALLRQMEAEPASLTCNHGRPTAVTLTLADLEKLFARR